MFGKKKEKEPEIRSNIDRFVVMVLDKAKQTCALGNRNECAAMIKALVNLLSKINGDELETLFGNPVYVDLRRTLLDLEVCEEALDSKEKLAKARITEIARKLKENKNYMTAAEWRNEQVNYANTLKGIENQRTEIQRRIALAQKQVDELEGQTMTHDDLDKEIEDILNSL